MTGTCCPVTLAHIAAFVESRRLLLSRGYDAVLGGLSLNSDQYVSKKLSEKGLPSISLQDRRYLVELASQEHEWLLYNSMTTFKDEYQFCKFHEDRCPHLRFDHYLLNGADDVIRRRKWKWKNVRQIAMCRPGATEELLLELKKAGIDVTGDKFLVGPELPDISSTAVRDALKAGDQDRLLELVHPDVARWCWEKGPYRPPARSNWKMPASKSNAALATCTNSTVIDSALAVDLNVDLHASQSFNVFETEEGSQRRQAVGSPRTKEPTSEVSSIVCTRSAPTESTQVVDLKTIQTLCGVGTAGEDVTRQKKAVSSGGSKGSRALIARETLDILANGGYMAPDTFEAIDISTRLCQAVAASTHFPTSAWNSSLKAPKQRSSIEVRCCTTLAAAQDLASCEHADAAPGVLNFASARNPGGGFTTGAEAQEESLARSSGIYPCLSKHFDVFFAPNRRAESGLYTHDLIFSPGVPVLRDSNGSLLNQPYYVDFVTAAAPNCGVLEGRCGAQKARQQCRDALDERIWRVLHTFASHGCVDLVLGAWGCGVFRNDASVVAQLFNSNLAKMGCFRRVVFAVLDPGMAEIFGRELKCPVDWGEECCLKGKGNSGKANSSGYNETTATEMPSDSKRRWSKR